jgi:hypothetical protein
MQETSSLFITDPLNSLNPKKDTTILWMQEVYDMGGQILLPTALKFKILPINLKSARRLMILNN